MRAGARNTIRIGCGLGLLAIVGAVLAIRHWANTSLEEDALVADVLRVCEAPVIRPSHVASPFPGTAGTWLQPHLSGLMAAHLRFGARPEDEKTALRSVLEGSLSPSEAPAEALAILADHRDAMRGALLSTHAEIGTPVDGMRVIGDPAAPLQSNGWLRIQAAGRMAGLDMRLLTIEGKADEALATCVDTLALVRDAEHGGALLGAMIGVSVTGLARVPCAEALDRASPAAKEEALRALLSIRKSRRSPSALLRDDFTTRELESFGFLLPVKKRDTLPPFAQKVLETTYDHSAIEALAAWLGWRKTRAYASRQAALFDAAIGDRDRGLGAFEADISKERNPFVGSVPRYQLFDDKLRMSRAQFDHVLVLVAADLFRGRTGKWPDDLEALVAAGLLTEVPVDGRTGRSIGFITGEKHFSLPRDPQNIARTGEAPRLEPVLAISADQRDR